MDEPEMGRVTKVLRISPQKAKVCFEILTTLFVIHRINPHGAGTGKPRYYLCDPGLATVLGASFERQLETAFYTEHLAKLSYHSLETAVAFSYYRSPKGSIIHGAWEREGQSALLKLFPLERIDERELLILKTTATKMAEQRKIPAVKTYFLSGSTAFETINSVRAMPRECLS